MLDTYFLLSKKWVFSFLHSDRRRSTVSGVNDSFVGEDKQTAANVLYQFIEVASCEISAADATLEQNVTREHAVVFFAIVHQAAG